MRKMRGSYAQNAPFLSVSKQKFFSSFNILSREANFSCVAPPRIGFPVFKVFIGIK
jgi:hypothetical protein